MFIKEEIFFPMKGSRGPYLATLMSEPFALQGFLRESERVRTDICPSVGMEIGGFLRFLIELTNSRSILEVGTSIGYSTTWLALGAKNTGGHVDTIEMSERLHVEAKRNLEAMALASWTTCHLGRGQEVIPKLGKTFDLIFVDGATADYPELFAASIKTLKTGGILVFEDILFAVSGKRVAQRRAMEEFNRQLISDPRIKTTPISIEDGLMLCRKVL